MWLAESRGSNSRERGDHNPSDSSKRGTSWTKMDGNGELQAGETPKCFVITIESR